MEVVNDASCFLFLPRNNIDFDFSTVSIIPYHSKIPCTQDWQILARRPLLQSY